ncbi:MAG: RNA polymerase sigma factor [Marvinbryantia sp.]|uniref:RNA polymerase sigma factor n=1 Tax=Marvinbryantia sp. TaxID=2496532 RepID=UPI0025FD614C|nr:sigma-70 family RNA polymerase sigma factor [uncultured Marvinbryantia sp.]
MKKEQLGELILASSDTMYHIAKTLLYEDADCADAIQDAIVKAFSKYHTLKNDAYAKTWLIRILINECYRTLRQKSRTIPMEAPLPEQAAAQENDYSELYEALAALPEDMRLAVALYYLEGYSVRETAKLLGTSESAVKNRLLRARAKLRRALEGKENETYVLR